MSNKSNSIMDFLRANAWGLLGLLIFVGSFYTMVNLRLTTLEVKAQENTQKIESLTSLVERVIRLEEHDNSFASDLQEIKQDLKEIKTAVK